jgi:hypothetical protein
MKSRLLVIATMLLFAIVSSASLASPGYALIIASGDFAPGSRYAAKTLTGPKADARLMATLLVWRFGFPARNIKLIGIGREDAALIAGGLRPMDERASFSAIRQGFAWLAGVASEADAPVVIYYSGHGRRVSNPDRMAHDVNSEALVPYDADMDGIDTNLVRDVQIKTWLRSIGSRRKTVIVDCCFSGDLIRDAPADAEGLPGGRVVRSLGAQKAMTTPSDRGPITLRGSAGPEEGSRSPLFGDDLPAGTVLLAACGKKDRAYEKRLPPTDGRPATGVGEFTWALYCVLCHDQRSISYEALRLRIERRLRERGLSQTPVILGHNEADEAICLAPWGDDRYPRVPLQGPGGQEAILGIGWFSGLRANRSLIPIGTAAPIRLTDIGWFDARAEGLRSPWKDYLMVRQFP